MAYFKDVHTCDEQNCGVYLKRALVLLGIAVLGGCCTTIPQNEGDPATVAEVVAKIKADIGEYQNYDSVASKQPPLHDACGGAVGFYIDNVTVSLTTATDNTLSGAASATLPVGLTTFGPSVGSSRETKGTQNLTFTLYPKPPEPQPDNKPVKTATIDANLYPIAASLQHLRDGLLEASKQKPCFSLVPLVPLPPTPTADGKPATPPTDKGGTYAFGFIVIKTSTAGTTLKFLVFSLGATNTAQRQAGNTITVTFRARPGSAAIN